MKSMKMIKEKGNTYKLIIDDKLVGSGYTLEDIIYILKGNNYA